jgi:hypothetical protein
MPAVTIQRIFQSYMKVQTLVMHINFSLIDVLRAIKIHVCGIIKSYSEAPPKQFWQPTLLVF